MTDAAERPQSVSQQIAARNKSGIAVLGLSPGYTLCTRLCLGTEAAGAASPVPGAAADEYNRDRC